MTLISVSCSNTEDKTETIPTNLFLNFPSRVTLEEYQRLAKENSELTVSKEATADYYYTFYLKSSSLKATIHPWFNSKTGGLEGLFVHGETPIRSQIEEFKNMFLEKYKTPKITSEETTIHTFDKSSCYNWTDGKKLIRLCIDSLKNNKVETYNYYYEINYVDSELKNIDLNKETKSAI
jgi:hypothetical protein